MLMRTAPAAPEPVREAASEPPAPDAAPDALDAVLDALPGAILASFREEQERLREEAARADAPAEAAERLAA